VAPLVNTLTLNPNPSVAILDYTNAVYSGTSLIHSTNIIAGGDNDIAQDFTAAIGWQDDPTFQGNFTPTEIVQSNGRWVDMAKPWSFRPQLKRRWLFQPTPDTGYDVADDPGTLRTQFSGQLNGMWRNGTDGTEQPFGLASAASSDSFLNLGTVKVSWKVQFRCPIDPDLDLMVANPEEKKNAVKMFSSAARTSRGLIASSSVSSGVSKGLLQSSIARSEVVSLPSEDDDEKSDVSPKIVIVGPKKAPRKLKN
jgi:hypothetical protein